MAKKRKYFPNNWKAYKEQDASFFIPITYDEFMDWKIAGWEMQPGVKCMIRETNKRTGKVKEYVYVREHAAKNKANEIMAQGESEFIICTPEEIHVMTPQYKEDYDDPLA